MLTIPRKVTPWFIYNSLFYCTLSSVVFLSRLLHLKQHTPSPPSLKMASISLLRLSLIPTPKTLSKSHPFSSFNPPLTPFLKFPPKTRLSQKSTVTRMSYNPTPATDRLVSAVSYTLPFFNSLQYGRFLFTKYPSLALLVDPLIPLLSLYRSIPYASFVAFFALYLGVVRNPSFSQYVRFNAMQAVTLDVLLVVPLLLTRILSPGRAGLGFKLMVWGHNALFLFSCFCFVYGLASSVLGKTPYLPFIAEAAGRQVWVVTSFLKTFLEKKRCNWLKP